MVVSVYFKLPSWPSLSWKQHFNISDRRKTNKLVIWSLVVMIIALSVAVPRGVMGDGGNLLFVSVCLPLCACWDMLHLYTTLKKNQ